jgi:hypothetical protein
MFIPSKNTLAVFLESQGRDSLRRTLQHEAFHQFAHAAISDELPTWINEGIAQVFEEGVFAGDRFIAAQLPDRRLRQLDADMDAGSLIPFKKFIATSPEDWARNMRDLDRAATQYNQAWAMVHFLVYATDGKQPVYRKRFFDMLKMIRNGMSPEQAFTASFGQNFAGFELRFREYYRSVKPTQESENVENVEVLADLMILLHQDEKMNFRSIVDFRNHLERGGYRLKYSSGQLKWSSDPDIGVYFKDDAGRDFPASQLNFIPNPRAPLPDLVLRPTGGLEYRARFYFDNDGKIEREIIIRNL